MKMSKSLKDYELSEDCLAAVEDLRINLVNAIIEEYDNGLRKSKMCIDPNDKVNLHEKLMDRMNVKLDMSVQLDESLLDSFYIEPVDMCQSRLEEYGV